MATITEMGQALSTRHLELPREYTAEELYELVNVGGVDCLVKEDEYWGEPCLIYLGRVENAGLNVSIEIQGDYNDARVAQLLAELKIHAEDIGYVDVPWYWEGEPFSASGATGFIGLDGNMREVVFWSADGTHMGALDDGDLFGTYYPWFCGGAVMDDGSILVVMTETRSDESAMELVAFKLSGF